MGVKNLWEVLDHGGGKVVQLDSLRNRRIAIDTSIWLIKYSRGLRDKQGKLDENAHLKGLFMRICKLLHYGAKPVFVFDGKAPLLKSATVARRRRAYELQIVNHEKAARKLLLQQQHQQQLQAMNTTTTTTTAASVAPTVQQQSATQTHRTTQQIDWGDFIFDDDEEERSMDKINAEVLMELPEEVRKELLEDSHYAKRKRKRERLAAPSSPADFCARQLNQLVASSSSLSKKSKSSSPAVKTSGHINSQDQGREYLLLRKTDDEDRSRIVDTEKPTKLNIDYRAILLPPQSPQSQLHHSVSRVDVLALKSTPLLLDVDKDESTEDDEEWEEVRADVATSPATSNSKAIENAAARRRSRWQSFLSQASPSIPRNGLEEVQKEMREEVSHLSVLARQQQQHVASQTDEVIKECQQLLRLFGVPFLRAPSEAEAQCAYLESQAMVDAVISDDSDTFLFGGNRVYRNIFDKEKDVQLYTSSLVRENTGLTREKMIELALLAGSDYTEGITGIGIVTAMEIIAEFDSLLEFKEWYTNSDSPTEANDTNNNQQRRQQLKKRLKHAKIEFKADFPQSLVVEAYLHPLVDESLEPFEWGLIDVEKLRQYALENFGWATELVDQYLNFASTSEQQSTLDSFLSEARPITAGPASKRLSQCIQQLKLKTNTVTSQSSDE